MGFHAYRRYLTHPLAAECASAEVTPEEQQSDYEAGNTIINGELWQLRTARITATKPGAFVAFWRRNLAGETRPLDAQEVRSGLLVFVQDSERFGVFRFTAEHLESLGITRSSKSPGKRGFRVYPSWCGELNATATRTQSSQSAAFIDLS